MNPTYQVLKHVFCTTTGKTETTKVGQPCLKTSARASSDKLNEEQVKAEGHPEGPLPSEIISYSISPASVRPPIHQRI
jgi:hypothetical protein